MPHRCSLSQSTAIVLMEEMTPWSFTYKGKSTRELRFDNQGEVHSNGEPLGLSHPWSPVEKFTTCKKSCWFAFVTGVRLAYFKSVLMETIFWFMSCAFFDILPGQTTRSWLSNHPNDWLDPAVKDFQGAYFYIGVIPGNEFKLAYFTRYMIKFFDS